MYSEDNDIRQIQENLLNLLDSFDNICKSNNIKYSLHGGSLLGAVREHGFIPWDDDADVTMTRTEYEKLKNLINNFPPNIYIKSVCGIPRFGTKSPVGDLWIDIFIYDSVSKNKLLQKMKSFILIFVDSLTRSKEDMQTIRGNLHSRFEILVFKFINTLGKIIPCKVRENLFENTCKNLFRGDGNFIHRANDQKIARAIVIPKEWMEEYTYLPFETSNFMVSKRYHDILVKSYGESYMTPIKDVKNCENHGKMRQFLAEH